MADVDRKPIKVDYYLNAKGLFCPEPVRLLHQKMRLLTIGEILKIETTDPTTQTDVVQFCHFLKHRLLRHCTAQVDVSTETGERGHHEGIAQERFFCFWIEKRA